MRKIKDIIAELFSQPEQIISRISDESVPIDPTDNDLQYAESGEDFGDIGDDD